jgi:hypothetical protein
MADIVEDRLASWRQTAGITERPLVQRGTTGIADARHRQQLERCKHLCMATIQAHEAFCAELGAHVAKAGRPPELQQQVTDFAAYILQAYERTNVRVLEEAIYNMLQDLPREVEVVRTVHVPARPRQSWVKRLFGG